MKILIVDDDPFEVKLLSRQFAKLGHHDVTGCQHAIEVITLLASSETPFDLITCDLQMPEMDGIEFMRQLASSNFVGDLLLVSGEDERILHTAEKLSRAHSLNVLGALHKPVSTAQLQLLLQNYAGYATRKSHAAAKTYNAQELQHAITENELINYYQPKVNVASGMVIGVETLVRWQHPQNGLVFPDQFIGLAEEHGLIDELTHTVLKNALDQARRWRDQGLKLQVAVNISMDNLNSLDFPDRVVHEANAVEVPLSILILEVTESRLMKNPLAILDILARLRLKHISLSIDDFGTGHSSLAQLRDLPFDELKVDRSFVHGAYRDASLRAIYEASVVMAGQLGMRSIAEGVENQDDWSFLRTFGCDMAQGYFIAKPMPAEELPPWIAHWETRRAGIAGGVA